MLVIWLRIVHSDVSCSSRSAGVDVFICAVRTGLSLLGPCTDVLLAVTVILSAGRLDAAKATCCRTITAAAASSRATSAVRIGERRARRTMTMQLLLPRGVDAPYLGAPERDLRSKVGASPREVRSGWITLKC